MARQRDAVVVFEGRRSPDGTRRFYWHHVGRNGEIDAQSQAYTRRDSARRAALRRFPLAAVKRA